MAELVTKRHPIRAALWGFVAGLGVLLMLTVVWPVIGLDSAAAVSIKAAIVVGGIMVLAVVWSMVAPPKKPKGQPPPSSPTSPMTPEGGTEASK